LVGAATDLARAAPAIVAAHDARVEVTASRQPKPCVADRSRARLRRARRRSQAA